MADDKWRNFYSAEAERYENARYGSRYGFSFRLAHRQVVASLLSRWGKRGAALDVASGTGQLIPSVLANADFLIASDLTPEMMKVARRVHGQSNVGYAQADALDLPFADASFDIVISSRFLHLFPMTTQQKMLMEMNRVAKPGGIIVVDVYNRIPRQILGIAISLYRKLRRKRDEGDYYSSPKETCALLHAAGLTQIDAHGVGSYFAAPLLWLPRLLLARLLRSGLFANRLMAEQWVVVGLRK